MSENFERALIATSDEERERLMSFVIVGAGPTGVELSGALAELKNKILSRDFPDLDLKLMRIHLIESGARVLGSMSENSSKKAKEYLVKLGVEIWTNNFVQSYENGVVLTTDAVFHTDTLIWAAGVKGQIPSGMDVLMIGAGNRIRVNKYCQLPSYPYVFALGDVALIESEMYPKGLPMLASVAMQQGKYLATSFERISKNKPLTEFIYKNKGSMATIGKNLAVVDINWSWNYFRQNNGLRLIIRKYKKSDKEA